LALSQRRSTEAGIVDRRLREAVVRKEELELDAARRFPIDAAAELVREPITVEGVRLSMAVLKKAIVDW